MKKTYNNIKFAWKYIKNNKTTVFLSLIISLFSIFISVVVPILGAKVILNLTSNNLHQVIYVGFIILITEICRNCVHYLISYFSQKLYRNALRLLQMDLGNTILKIENKCFDETSSGLFIHRFSRDSEQIADYYNVLNIYLTNIITNIGIFIAIFLISKQIFLVIIIFLIVLYFLEKRKAKKTNEYDKIYRAQAEKTDGFISELVRGVRDIKMLNAEESFKIELNNKIIDQNNKKYKMSDCTRKFVFLNGSISDLLDFLTLVFMVVFIIKGELLIANALVIHNYLARICSVTIFFSQLMEKTKEFNLSTERIRNIIEGEEFSKEKFGKIKLGKAKGDFEFKNVSFSYKKDKKILKNISFKIKADETVAFVGKSGTGKTTIFNLICKMYNADSGKITIDGYDINELDKDSIRGNITIINQNPYIFNMSIRDNLRLVKEDLTEEEMKKACKLACLENFINSLPERYDTVVGEGGINLSGGQRQRLAIARALVQNTEIILFDEATSALDNETQKEIQKAIDNLKNDYTILIIAHRLSTIINSDRILFLEDGKIIKEGTHKNLLKTCKEYKKLYESEIEK